MEGFIELNNKIVSFWHVLKPRIYFVVFFILSLFIFHIKKNLFFVSFFIILDIANSLIEHYFNLNSSVIHIMEFGIYTVSYKFGFLYGLVLMGAYSIIRIVTCDFSINKLKKLFFLIPISIILFKLNYLPFALIAIPLYLFRYAVEFFLLRTYPEKIFKRGLRIIVMLILFVFISPILFSIM